MRPGDSKLEILEVMAQQPGSRILKRVAGLAGKRRSKASGASDLLNEFACGEAALDHWLQRRALANQVTGASRCFVVADGEQRVHGYYAMAAGAVSHQWATGSVRRNMPDPVPVMVLARLAVDHRAQGSRLGAALLQDAVSRALLLAQNAGVRALLVHALHDRARQFHEHYGFQVSPAHPMTLMLRLNLAKP